MITPYFPSTQLRFIGSWGSGLDLEMAAEWGKIPCLVLDLEKQGSKVLSLKWLRKRLKFQGISHLVLEKAEEREKLFASFRPRPWENSTKGLFLDLVLARWPLENLFLDSLSEYEFKGVLRGLMASGWLCAGICRDGKGLYLEFICSHLSLGFTEHWWYVFLVLIHRMMPWTLNCAYNKFCH